MGDCIELGGIGPQRGFDVVQGFSPSQLRIGHDAKVLGAGQCGNPRIARVARHDACKTAPRHEVHPLSKKRLAKIHEQSPKLSTLGNSLKMQRNSN